MANLLIITQKVDENDDLLGFFVDWIAEFSKHFESVSVITLAKGNYSLPDNVSVHSLGKEIGRSKLFQSLKFYWLLFKFVPSSYGIFAHMSPIFAVTSWPVTAIYRKKIILWYLHRSLTFKLKLADFLSYKIVTAAKESLTLKSNKIIEVGHGIDIHRFHIERIWERISQKPSKILSVGRISAIKNYPTLISAISIIKNKFPDIKVQIVGRPVMKDDFQIFESLKKQISRLNLQTNIELSGFVPYSRIKPYYENNYININLTPPGGIDKAVLEGMASRQLTLTSNSVFTKYLGSYKNLLIFEYKNPKDLADKLEYLLKLPASEKNKIADFLLEMVKKEHSLERLIHNIIIQL